MKRPCIAATAFAMGLVIASISANAATAPRDRPAGGMAAQFSVAATTVLDGLKPGHASQNPLLPALSPRSDFPDASSLLSTEDSVRDPLAMTLACFGLMGMIAYRRLIL